MFDFQALCVGIVAKINATGGTSAIANKTWYDAVPEQLPDGTPVARPYCRFADAGDVINKFYGGAALDTIQLLFQVWADDQATANNTIKALNTAFEKATLSLSSGVNVSCQRFSGSSRRSAQEQPTKRVYLSSTIIEFRVSS